jgi:diaminohydroxyphosphoribosylaminopyrimidine deaminase/5-amino-6-(5-phosphoribosylamino)uracil reductase
MRQCIELAKRGEGAVSPNPLVGCIVLDAAGNKISEGRHEKYGGNHAECNALQGVEAQGGTLIVNLEPCSHHGKTPPCTDLIIEKGIKRVVIGMRDPNPLVNGVKQLREAGIEVIEGVLEHECRRLNEVFVVNKTENRIFVAIKTAATLDGKTATANGSSKWITSESARAEVRNIRKRYDAIMTTSATVLADDPEMEHKTKIILDRNSRLSGNEKIFQQGAHLVRGEGGITLLNELYELGIMSVLIEAGGRFNGEMLESTDKIYHFIAPKITGDNSAKSCFDFRKITDINDSLNFQIDSVKHFGPDILLEYYPK